MTTGSIPPLFTVRVTVPAPNRARVHVGGEIDMESGPRIEDLMYRELDDGRVHIEVDLGSVEFMDSSGVHLLLRVRRRALDAGGGLDLLAAGPRVVRLLEVTGLTEFLPAPRRVVPALDGDAATATGSYTWNLRTDAWWWSPETYQILGLAPDSVRPSTDLMLSLRHPDDARGTADDAETADAKPSAGPEAFAGTEVDGEPFISRHRLLLTDGTTRTVAVVGEVMVDDNGEPVQMTGFFVDVTNESTEPSEGPAGGS
ncbi:anti-sigma factor antagonist [Yinghuangia sp. ASG 101]|uniref:anti-sigma factor antagonist n=1 Tax=Yinghuangia sp. ASG 101 TaxID=2896848 RepID=UPI001E397768|nr:anti-sigma factor antagonist [Yinghuangia sp. ASG 101]UGQ08973.1 anti-sigma factor antagonist [Yinghuangia sp. ASG 101]